MDNDSYFRFNDANKMKSKYSHSHQREMGKLKTHRPIYCMKDDWENGLNLKHTLDRIYLTGILIVEYFQKSLHNDDN